MSIVGQKMIDFTASAVMQDGGIVDDFNLSEYIEGSYGILFFYPLDFTFVCPTELIALSNRISDFSERNTKVISISIDSKFSHFAWRETPTDRGGLGSVAYPMVSDITKSISAAYNVLHEGAVALRGTFIIDDLGIVRHESINDLPIGRNIDEYMRLVDAIKHHEEYGEVCPAGWSRGKASMKATAPGVADFLASNAQDL